MHCPTAMRSLPSRITASRSRQIDVRVVQDVRRYRQPDAVNTFRCQTSDSRNVVQHRSDESLGERLSHHFPQKTNTLFKEYIDTFAKIKLEASGYPKDCVTDKQKQWYVDDILENQGIQ